MTDVSQEQRDARGRWTAGGRSEWTITEGPEGNTRTYTKWSSPGHPDISLSDESKFENARRYALAFTDVAKREGFDPTRINITDSEHPFMLNGVEHKAAGTAGSNGIIQIYLNQISPGFVNELGTHEIEHEKFHAFLADYRDEHRQVMALPTTQYSKPDPDGTIHQTAPDPMKADGTLREPWASQFPTYTKYVALLEGTNQDPDLSARMAREDGLTPYSKDWWDAYKAGTVPRDNAIHETLAEMAAVRSRKGRGENDPGGYEPAGSPNAAPPTAKRFADYGKGPESEEGWLVSSKPSKDWIALYNAVNDNWQKKHAK